MNTENIKVEPLTAKWNDIELGALDGDIEIKFKEDSVDIKAHETGSNILDAIRTGKVVEAISLTMQESSLEKILDFLSMGDSADAEAVETGIECVADVAGSLNNKFFIINSAHDAQKYLVWFNVNSEGVEPELSGMTGVEVALATGALASAVATAVASALDGLSAFVASAVGSMVTCTNAAQGVTSAPSEGNSGFTITIPTPGANQLYGLGMSKDFTSQAADAKKLAFHPVRNVASDYDEDMAAWKAYPVIESIVHSGEKQKLVKVLFKIFPDFSKPSEICYFVFGNHT